MGHRAVAFNFNLRPMQPIKSNVTSTFQVFGLAMRIKESKDSSQTKTFPSAAGIELVGVGGGGEVCFVELSVTLFNLIQRIMDCDSYLPRFQIKRNLPSCSILHESDAKIWSDRRLDQAKKIVRYLSFHCCRD